MGMNSNLFDIIILKARAEKTTRETVVQDSALLSFYLIFDFWFTSLHSPYHHDRILSPECFHHGFGIEIRTHPRCVEEHYVDIGPLILIQCQVVSSSSSIRSIHCMGPVSWVSAAMCLVSGSYQLQCSLHHSTTPLRGKNLLLNVPIYFLTNMFEIRDHFWLKSEYG